MRRRLYGLAETSFAAGFVLLAVPVAAGIVGLAIVARGMGAVLERLDDGGAA